MPKRSAGLLLYRGVGAALEVLPVFLRDGAEKAMHALHTKAGG